MQTRHAAVLDASIRIQRFLDANAAASGPVNRSGARRSLDEAIVRLTDDSIALETHTTRAIGETSRLDMLRQELRRSFIKPIVEMSRTRLGELPQLAQLRLPRQNLKGVRLIIWANALADAVEPFEAELATAGLNTDLLVAFRKSIAEYEESVNARRDFWRGRGSAAIRLGADVRTARRAIRMLTAAVTQQVDGDEQFMKEWTAIRHLSTSVQG